MSETNIKPMEPIGETRRKLVVLIDSENVCSTNIDQVFETIWTLGDPIVQRIYGDFSSSHSTRWKDAIEKYAMKQVQQSACIKGKNATDCLLIIDAMDLLYTGRYEGFCIVSSDSDFTSLAIRLREAGLLVYGFGNVSAHEAYRAACYRFYVVDPVKSVAKSQTLTNSKPVSSNGKLIAVDKAVEQPKVESAPKKKLPIAEILRAFAKVKPDDGWATLVTLGSALRVEIPGFEPKHYGYKQLSSLVKTRTDLFAVREEIPEGKKQKVVFVKVRS